MRARMHNAHKHKVTFIKSYSLTRKIENERREQKINKSERNHCHIMMATLFVVDFFKQKSEQEK